MAQRQTYFSEDWCSKPEFKYIRAGQSTSSTLRLSTTAFCSLCQKEIKLSNMGRRAIISHVKGTMHIKKVREHEGNYGIKIFAVSKVSKQRLATSSSEVAAEVDETGPAASCSTSSVRPEALDQPAAALPGGASDYRAPDTVHDIVPEASGLIGLNKHLVRNDVTKAEILWTMHCVINHCSMSAGGKAVKLFPKMFPDSIIAAKIELGRLKLGYTIVHGLAPYFHDQVNQELREIKYFVVMFDESLNKCSQKTQMDLAVKFWCSRTDEVVTRYYDSVFLGRSRASDLVDSFSLKFRPELLRRLLIVAMDGPNVNYKFLKDIQIHLKTLKDKEEDDPDLLLMGSCGLHAVHNAFKEGVNATGWSIVMYLRASYNVFKDVPARRSKYTEWTGSSKFPVKYCAVRWLNNASVADTGNKILPNLRTFVEKVESGPKEDKIKSASFCHLAKIVKDNLLGPKLAFFSYVARLVEPFLRAYQTNAPMAPFLHTDLTALVTDLFKHFVDKDYLNQKSDVCDVDITKEANLIPVKDFKFSFSVKEALKNVTLSNKEMFDFKEQCVALLKKMSIKILEKSPLHYKLCKAITFCDPELIGKSEHAALARLRSCLTVLMNKKWLSSLDCEKIESEFKVFIRKTCVRHCIQEYDKDVTRLDHFWRDILKSQKSSELLSDLIHMVLIISHGNAFVERGFSINKEIVVENQLDISLVAQRQVYDAINLAGGLENISIDAKIISRVRHARSEYEAARKQRSEADKEKELKRKDQMLIGEEVKELKAKKMKLMLEKQLECEAIDERLKVLTGCL